MEPTDRPPTDDPLAETRPRTLRGFGYFISRATIGYHFELATGTSTELDHGWRPTRRWAKRAARQRLATAA